MRLYLTDDANRLVRDHRLDLRAVLDHMERAALSQQWTFHYVLPLQHGPPPSAALHRSTVTSSLPPASLPVLHPTLRFDVVEIAADDGVLWTAK